MSRLLLKTVLPWGNPTNGWALGSKCPWYATCLSNPIDFLVYLDSCPCLITDSEYVVLFGEWGVCAWGGGGSLFHRSSQQKDESWLGGGQRLSGSVAIQCRETQAKALIETRPEDGRFNILSVGRCLPMLLPNICCRILFLDRKKGRAELVCVCV